MLARILVALLFLVGPASADFISELAVLDDQLDTAFANNAGATGLDNRDQSLARLVDVQDDILSIARSIDRLQEAELRKLRAKLSAERNALSQSVGALHALNQAPLPQLLLNPNGAIGTVEATLMFQGMVPHLEDAQKRTEQGLERLLEVSTQLTDVGTRLLDFYNLTQAARATLNSNASARIELPLRFADQNNAKQAKRDASNALSNLIALLRAHSKLNVSGRKNLLGQLAWPIPSQNPPEARTQGVGDTLQHWVEITPTQFGPIGAAADGTILFAGDLQKNMPVIILEPERDLLVFLRGHSRNLVKAGDIVTKGQKIALFEPSVLADKGLSSQSDPVQVGKAQKQIYLEVRIAGVPVEPLEWFEQEQRETSE